MEVQIFGVRNDAATRKALRFFSERRVRTHFVDLKQRAASRGELRRFVERFGVEGIMDREGRRFNSLGLAHAYLSHDRWVEKLVEEPLLLRTPLVRNGDRLTVGSAEEAWRAWLTPA
ncbi:MAG: ArsC/Spx/MgsR family protein [Gemmatimonadota bacterium]